jgi:hypothetical protein
MVLYPPTSVRQSSQLADSPDKCAKICNPDRFLAAIQAVFGFVSLFSSFPKEIVLRPLSYQLPAVVPHVYSDPPAGSNLGQANFMHPENPDKIIFLKGATFQNEQGQLSPLFHTKRVIHRIHEASYFIHIGYPVGQFNRGSSLSFPQPIKSDNPGAHFLNPSSCLHNTLGIWARNCFGNPDISRI